jgi:RNA polymerase sigma-70 factor (ECF subfamily)
MTRTARQPPHPGVDLAARRSDPAATVLPEAQGRADRDAHLATLLAATAGGDAGAFEAFYGATFAYARTVARRLLRDSAEIEDLLADCYFEAWRSAGRFDPARGSPVTWLLTLVRSRGLDALRAAAARPARACGEGPAGREGAPSRGEDVTPPEASASADTDPAESLWRRESGAALHAALGALTAPERWVLGLAYLRELPHAEIARCTGMPLGTVKSHALRAQNKLRAWLTPGVVDRVGGDGASNTPS